MIPESSFATPVAAAGAVVWKGAERVREVLVVHRPRGDWSFPKCKVNPGEQLVAAAVREVREETGYRIRLGPWLGKSCTASVTSPDQRGSG